jgi:hypothetical protein
MATCQVDDVPTIVPENIDKFMGRDYCKEIDSEYDTYKKIASFPPHTIVNQAVSQQLNSSFIAVPTHRTPTYKRGAPNLAPSFSPGEEDEEDEHPNSKKRCILPVQKPSITEENTLLLELKDKKGLDWPAISEAFREHGWVGRKVGLLKNRYKSLKNGTIFWEDDDVSAFHFLLLSSLLYLFRECRGLKRVRG